MVTEIASDVNKTDHSIPRTLCQDLLIRLCEQKLRGKLCDVQFFYGNSLLWAHSCVLASFSPFMMRFFIRFLNSDVEWSAKTPFKIHISAITKCRGESKNNCMDCVCKVIDFIYTGKIKLEPPHVEHIVNISSNLELDNLILICQKYRNDRNNENVKTGDTEDALQSIIENNVKSCESDFESLRITGKAVEEIEAVSDIASNYSMCLDTKNAQFLSNILHNNITENVNLNDGILSTNGKDDCINSSYTEENVSSYSCVTGSTQFASNENLVNDESVFMSVETNNESNLIITGAGNTQFENNNEENRKSEEVVINNRGTGDREDISISETEDDVRENFSNIEGAENSCKRCNVSFSDSLKLRQHEQIYHTRKFLCLCCNFTSFKLVYILKHLMESNHGDNVCSICLYEASDNNALKKHFDDHKHSLPFLCCVCSERFKTRTEWNRHVATHSSETPFVCKLCNVTFKKCSYLQNHILTHHKKPKHLCELCGYATPFKSFLVRHKLKHSERKINCPVSSCGFQTVRETNLKQHLKIHDSEKPFKCSICNVLFSQNKNLRRHIQLVHNPHVTMFECPGCTYVNTRIDKVKEHISNNHSKDKTILDKINEQYEKFKKNQVSRVIPKYQRSNSNQKSYTKVKDNFKRKELHKTSNTAFAGGNNEINTATETEKQEMQLSKDDMHISTRPLISTIANRSEIISNSSDSILEGSNTINPSNKQTVFLSEATGEITIMSNQEGQPIPVASLTSTNLLTIGNFREGTGSVTLNEATGVLTLNNINSESTGAVFLNESTGELSYINLNQDSCSSVQIDDCKPDKITGINYNQEFATLLNEVTGEISTVQENNATNNNLYEDDMFDSFDIDAFNEDSFDGFDEFDGYLFDSLNPSGVETESTMENFLNEFTGELLQESANINRLNEVSSGIKNDQEPNLTQEMWSSLDQSLDLNITASTHNVLNQTILNEVTGEFF